MEGAERHERERGWAGNGNGVGYSVHIGPQVVCQERLLKRTCECVTAQKWAATP